MSRIKKSLDSTSGETCSCTCIDIRAAVTSLAYAYLRGYVRYIKGYVSFKSSAILNNFYFQKTLRGYASSNFYVREYFNRSWLGTAALEHMNLVGVWKINEGSVNRVNFSSQEYPIKLEQCPGPGLLCDWKDFVEIYKDKLECKFDEVCSEEEEGGIKTSSASDEEEISNSSSRSANSIFSNVLLLLLALTGYFIQCNTQWTVFIFLVQSVFLNLCVSQGSS